MQDSLAHTRIGVPVLIFLVLVLFGSIVFGLGYLQGKRDVSVVPTVPIAPPVDDPDMVFCTADAKMCPDGSSVARIPPTCEFALCPGETKKEDPKKNWIEFVQKSAMPNSPFRRYSIKYPSTWEKTYENNGVDGNKLLLSRLNYTLRIIQGDMGGTSCLFGDEGLTDLDQYDVGNDFRGMKYQTIISSFGSLRRAENPLQESPQSGRNYVVCQIFDSGFFSIPTDIGLIRFFDPSDTFGKRACRNGCNSFDNPGAVLGESILVYYSSCIKKKR